MQKEDIDEVHKKMKVPRHEPDLIREIKCDLSLGYSPPYRKCLNPHLTRRLSTLREEDVWSIIKGTKHLGMLTIAALILGTEDPFP